MGNSLFFIFLFFLYYFSCVTASYERTFIITHSFTIPLSVRYNLRGFSERLVAKKTVKSGSGQSYVSFLVKDLLELKRTLGNTSFFHSALKTAPKKLLALKSFMSAKIKSGKRGHYL